MAWLCHSLAAKVQTLPIAPLLGELSAKLTEGDFDSLLRASTPSVTLRSATRATSPKPRYALGEELVQTILTTLNDQAMAGLAFRACIQWRRRSFSQVSRPMPVISSSSSASTMA